jgi:hypothetical protein
MKIHYVLFAACIQFMLLFIFQVKKMNLRKQANNNIESEWKWLQERFFMQPHDA